jgi:hypothetical protein
MGYTHYMKNKPAFTDAEWKQFRAKAREIFKNSPVPLGNGCGDEGSKPMFGASRIMFNGVGDDSYETCCVDRDEMEFEFCKTARKPYDSVVVAIYKAVRDILPSTELSSDGGKEIFNPEPPAYGKKEDQADAFPEEE